MVEKVRARAADWRSPILPWEVARCGAYQYASADGTSLDPARCGTRETSSNGTNGRRGGLRGAGRSHYPSIWSPPSTGASEITVDTSAPAATGWQSVLLRRHRPVRKPSQLSGPLPGFAGSACQTIPSRRGDTIWGTRFPGLVVRSWRPPKACPSDRPTAASLLSPHWKTRQCAGTGRCDASIGGMAAARMGENQLRQKSSTRRQ
jgi:hypothetical protein